MGDITELARCGTALNAWRQRPGVPVKRRSMPEAPTVIPAPRIVLPAGLRGIFAAWAAKNQAEKIG